MIEKKEICNYCAGDEALYWKDGENNAFIDSYGEILVTVNGIPMKFKVPRCPMCGRIFDVQKYSWLSSNDDIYYVDEELGLVEHGKIFSVHFKDGEVESFSVDFDCGDFDEFKGEALGTDFFTNKAEAEAILRGLV